MEIEKYIDYGKINAIFNVESKKICLDDSFILLKIKDKYPNVRVKDYLLQETNCEEQRVQDSLKLVHLEEEVLNRKMSVLSSSEKLKVELAVLLILNVSVIVFDHFDSYFMEKELLFFKKLFKKLVKKYQKTFVFFNSNPIFLFEFADRIIIKKNKRKSLVIDNPTFYESELLSFLEKTPIVDFVTYLNVLGKKFLPYTDLKELLKAIFREV